MILVDSSVWIDFLNGNESEKVDVMCLLLDKGRVRTNQFIRFEVLAGIKHDKDLKAAKTIFDAIPILTIVEDEVFTKSVDFYRQLRKKGITIRKTVDVLIATQCILLEIPLLHNDRDFESFVSLGLKVHDKT